MHKKFCNKCQKEFVTNTITKICDECKNIKPLCLCGCGEKVIKNNVKYIKGHAHYNKGIKHSVETKKLISDKSKEKWKDPIYRQNLINKIKIYKNDENTKKLISIQTKERWKDENYKISTSKKIKESLNNPEHKKIVGLQTKERWNDPIYKQKIKDKFNTPEYKQNYKNKMNTPENKQKLRESGLKTQEILIKNIPFKYSDTKPEREMEKILIELNIKYEKQKPIRNIIHMYPCDFYLPDINTILEIDGKYWHNYPNGTEKDSIRKIELESANYKLIRFWEDEFNLNIVKEKFINQKILVY